MPLSPAIEAIIEKQREQFSGHANDIVHGLPKLGGADVTGSDFMPGMCTMTEIAEMYASGELSDEIIEEEARALKTRLV